MKARDIIFCEISEGELLPPFYYGLAYRDYATFHSYWYIMPINYFIRWGKWIQHKWNRFRSYPSWIDNEILKAIKNNKEWSK